MNYQTCFCTAKEDTSFCIQMCAIWVAYTYLQIYSSLLEFFNELIYYEALWTVGARKCNGHSTNYTYSHFTFHFVGPDAIQQFIVKQPPTQPASNGPQLSTKWSLNHKRSLHVWLAQNTETQWQIHGDKKGKKHLLKSRSSSLGVLEFFKGAAVTIT